MAPQYATYVQAANDIYNPQETADVNSATTAHTNTINSLESSKSGVQQTYDNSIYDLNQKTQQNAAQIQQQYTLALGGNFSGLQGNDLGMMFADAAHDQANISLTRDNALKDITGQETAEDASYNTDVANIHSTYQSKRAQYADEGYAGAVKDYQDEQLQEEKLALQEQSMEETARHNQAEEANSASSANNSLLNQFKATQRSGGGFGYTGPNGQAINLGQYAKAISGGDTASTISVIRNQLSASSTATDKAALNYLNSQIAKYGASSSKVIGAIANKADFKVLFNGM